MGVNGKDPKHKCDRVGTQWAALSAYLAIHTLSPDLIINAGTCGGVIPKYCFGDDADETNMEIADVFIGQSVIYSDRRIPFAPFTPWDAGHFRLFGASYLSQ